MPKKDSKLQSFEDYCKQIKHLRHLKELPEIEFLKKAKELYNKKYSDELEKIKSEDDTTENDVGIWKSKEEAKDALHLFREYQRNKEFTDFSDIEVLKQLVYFRIHQKRMQAILNTSDKINDRALLAYDKVQSNILNLSKQLGLLEESEGKDPLEEWNKLTRKAKVWRDKNRIAFEARCDHCSKMVLFTIRSKIQIKGEWVQVYDVIKHPFFRDKVLCNPWMWELYKQKKITKLDIAKMLFPEQWKEMKVTYYVDWLEKKIFEPEEMRAELEQKDES